jgi:hypothetical protein
LLEQKRQLVERSGNFSRLAAVTVENGQEVTLYLRRGLSER